jgi:predicted nucleic acid-binding Zn ribbon protein
MRLTPHPLRSKRISFKRVQKCHAHALNVRFPRSTYSFTFQTAVRSRQLSRRAANFNRINLSFQLTRIENAPERSAANWEASATRCVVASNG